LKIAVTLDDLGLWGMSNFFTVIGFSNELCQKSEQIELIFGMKAMRYM